MPPLRHGFGIAAPDYLPAATPSRSRHPYDRASPELLLPTPTFRQLEIAQMYADGLTTDAIAARLELAPETVRNHTKRLLIRMQKHSRTEVVAHLIRRGLIE